MISQYTRGICMTEEEWTKIKKATEERLREDMYGANRRFYDGLNKESDRQFNKLMLQLFLPLLILSIVIFWSR